MSKMLLKWWVLGTAVCVGLNVLVPSESVAQQRLPSIPGRSVAPFGSKPSLTESISSKFKNGFDVFAEMVTPKVPVQAPDDPVALKTKPQPGAELYVRVGRLYEQSGDLAKAAEQYEKALGHTPNYFGALLGYARLKDQMGKPEEARSLYQRAAKVHPNQPALYNNLALFNARHGRLAEAVAAMDRAVQLQPNNAKYRNNVATLLVELGRTREAFIHLQTVHREPVAYFNLGYLLEKKGQVQAAAEHYSIALRQDHGLTQAKQGLARLANSLMQARVPARRSAVPMRPLPPLQEVSPRDVRPQEVRPPRNGLPRNPMRTNISPELPRPSTQPLRSSAGPFSSGRPPVMRQLPPAPSEAAIPSRLPATSERRATLSSLPPLPEERRTGPTVPNAPLPP